MLALISLRLQEFLFVERKTTHQRRPLIVLQRKLRPLYRLDIFDIDHADSSSHPIALSRPNSLDFEEILPVFGFIPYELERIVCRCERPDERDVKSVFEYFFRDDLVFESVDDL